MATYKKTLISIAIWTLMRNGGAPFIATNTDAFEVIKANGIVEAEAQTVLIPAHAIREYQKNVGSYNAEKADAYCE